MNNTETAATLIRISQDWGLVEWDMFLNLKDQQEFLEGQAAPTEDDGPVDLPL